MFFRRKGDNMFCNNSNIVSLKQISAKKKKKIKYLGINLTKKVKNLSSENYDTEERG